MEQKTGARASERPSARQGIPMSSGRAVAPPAVALSRAERAATMPRTSEIGHGARPARPGRAGMFYGAAGIRVSVALIVVHRCLGGACHGKRSGLSPVFRPTGKARRCEDPDRGIQCLVLYPRVGLHKMLRRVPDRVRAGWWCPPEASAAQRGPGATRVTGGVRYGLPFLTHIAGCRHGGFRRV
jgi:hypothetical protein